MSRSKVDVAQYPSYCKYIPVISQLLASLSKRGDVVAKQKGLSESVYDGAKMPSIALEDYLNRWVRYSFCSKETFVLAVVYIDRLSHATNVVITSLNVHRLVLTSLVLAAKARDDIYYSNKYYASIGGITTKEMNRLEAQWLTDIDWHVFISPEQYVMYTSEFNKHAGMQSATEEAR
eukprot:TRINITY_DN5155_c0_g3_i3.p2 TRINITY_DN5155_c0_g3~~TRINITY_DN5155_c0_g3_i3.p2  ORF type:complete len:177 (+),score=26.62 TRINITY_DN5155_c0_g3_i3:84-614(+)